MIPRSRRAWDHSARVSERPRFSSSFLSGWHQARSQARLAPQRDTDARAGSPLEAILTEFTERWERGEAPSPEEYLSRLMPDRSSDAVELIYCAYCLAESAGLDPDPAEYLRRFPEQSESLERLFGLHRALDSVQLRLWTEPVDWPKVGDEIGPYHLLRELGRGGFARVFLAEQADLEDRLVVVKVSTRVGEHGPLAQAQLRGEHPHIVGVLWHGQVDDGTFQLIAMPFLGGATLAAVLAERRQRGERPTSGRDLLADLDRVSATEYPAASLARPAREILEGLSYPKAVAWTVARLAEALDHAYSHRVAHGDIKPSNVLLTADGNPMLLDFNLASAGDLVGWRSHGAEDLPDDAGGTLPYMPPERLRALADPSQSSLPRALDRHRADLYSLGVVLLESLTGRPPTQPCEQACAPRELADALAASRQVDGERMIRASSGASIPPALRSILVRCLAPDPVDRYRRASELAEDLDRWRTDRALAFALEPPWRSGLRRWARRHRSTLAAATLCLIIGIFTTLAVRSAFRSSLRDQATNKLARIWDQADSGIFRIRRSGHWEFEEQGDPADNALRYLNLYDVLGPDDWRQRDDVRHLSENDRAELEMWLFEQSLRLARSLGERPNSPADWERALALLDRIVATTDLGPLETQCWNLRKQLDGNGYPSPAGNRPPRETPPHWLEEYLLGVEAEPYRPSEALAHYDNVLKERPRSFWAHYRAAAVVYRLSDFLATIKHLEECIAQRPGNPSLHAQLAGCLYRLNRLDEAFEECNKALAPNPDHTEFYLSRVYIRRLLGQMGSFEADLDRIELLKHRQEKFSYPHPGSPLSPEIDRMLDRIGADVALPRQVLEVDPRDLDIRLRIAARLRDVGYLDAALEEFNLILEMNPDHLPARFHRAVLLRKMRRAEAESDFSFLLAHPRFEDLLRETSYAIRIFHYNSWDHLRHQRYDEAERVAKQGLAVADRLGEFQGESHYALAQVYAVGARKHPDWFPCAIAHFQVAFRGKTIRHWFDRDSLLDAQRANIMAALSHSPREDR
jgi:serine/threonine protein kinase